MSLINVHINRPTRIFFPSNKSCMLFEIITLFETPLLPSMAGQCFCLGSYFSFFHVLYPPRVHDRTNDSLRFIGPSPNRCCHSPSSDLVPTHLLSHSCLLWLGVNLQHANECLLLTLVLLCLLSWLRQQHDKNISLEF